MARTGKKVIYIDVDATWEIEEVSQFLKHRNKGLRYHIKYEHDSGLEITLFGPDDKIKMVEYALLQHLDSTKDQNQ